MQLSHQCQQDVCAKVNGHPVLEFREVYFVIVIDILWLFTKTALNHRYNFVVETTQCTQQHKFLLNNHKRDFPGNKPCVLWFSVGSTRDGI